MKKEDLRVTKTKRNLYEGLLSLMRDKTFEEIKVSDICSEALINRSTFYDHFTDKYELLNSLITDLRTELTKKLNENDIKTNCKDYYMKMIELFLDHVSENAKVYSSIVRKNNNSIVMDMAYDVIYKDVENHLSENINYDALNVPPEIISKFYVSAIIKVCVDYIKYPNKYKKEDIIKYINLLLPKQIY